MDEPIKPQYDIPPEVTKRKEALWLYLTAAAALALALVISVVSVAVLAFNDKQVPDILSGVAVGLVTALAAMIAPAVPGRSVT
jgi:hypothetical protein